MNPRIPLLLALGAAMLAPVASSHAAVTVQSLLSRFNVITGDYTAGNETEGSAFVMGQYYPQDSRSRFGFNSGQVSNDSVNS
ncbi:MAG: hypothetical protein EOP85_11930, partial [Verrucomicrobiaceae bacterium]